MHRRHRSSPITFMFSDSRTIRSTRSGARSSPSMRTARNAGRSRGRASCREIPRRARRSQRQSPRHHPPILRVSLRTERHRHALPMLLATRDRASVRVSDFTPTHTLGDCLFPPRTNTEIETTGSRSRPERHFTIPWPHCASSSCARCSSAGCRVAPCCLFELERERSALSSTSRLGSVVLSLAAARASDRVRADRLCVENRDRDRRGRRTLLRPTGTTENALLIGCAHSDLFRLLAAYVSSAWRHRGIYVPVDRSVAWQSHVSQAAW